MYYFQFVIFLAFLIAHIYIVQMNKNAVEKRRAFRLWLAVFGAFMVLYFSWTITDKIWLVVVIPILAMVLFGWLKFTKFCNWCGQMVRTNLPFLVNNRCPRCGEPLS